MKLVLLFAFALFLVNSVPVEKFSEGRAYVEPEYLDALLSEGRYEEFSNLMGLGDPHLAMPRTESDKKDPATADPSFMRELFEGDMLLTPELEEIARQGMNFGARPRYQWQEYMPYVLSDNFTNTDKSRIQNGINAWNGNLGPDCITLVPRKNETNYVFVTNGRGCYSYLGRQGGAQILSLSRDGCLVLGTILHEFTHAVGMAHEQSRPDRDDYLEILWNNIPNDWHSQYKKESSAVFGIQGPYECSSVMHYSNRAPGTGKPAFKSLNGSCPNPSRMGQRGGQTHWDIVKIKTLQNCPLN